LAATGPDEVGSPAWLSLLEEAFAYLDQARILTFTRKGWHGATAINRLLRERLAPLWDAQATPSRNAGTEAFHGAPILIEENEYGKDLFNGEVGLMLRVRGRCQAWFRKEGGFRSYPAQFLPRHELAFASTVHKAQGSEYDQVMIVLPEAGNRLLFKETLYTALTRARQFVGLYGPSEVFLEAVGRKVERESGLREFLAGPGGP
jgi:exodeoxyribonuclease V alpha subunit